jgi:hypothetical protein
MKKLTIGMPVYDDYDGVFFTIQALRMYHPMHEVELLVVDNNPDSEHGKTTRKFSQDAGARYIAAPEVKGSGPTKELVFTNATTPYVMCLDCHVLVWPNAIERLLEYFNTDQGDILHGPLIYNDLRSISTHMDPVWRGGSLGIWATDKRGCELDAEPFEIPAQGMGLFACRKDAWPNFHPAFRGFGSEECYIHGKFRQQGARAMCLPFLRWAHRFGRPSGVPFPMRWEDRIFNYLLGHLELGLPIEPVLDHFKTLNLSNILPDLLAQAQNTFQSSQTKLISPQHLSPH